jgi:SNF2 family DNA or RNA helicase
VCRLSFCWYNKQNSILADEMGLGKTVQSVAILEYIRRNAPCRGPFLVIAPLSTVPHWKREFEVRPVAPWLVHMVYCDRLRSRDGRT